MEFLGFIAANVTGHSAVDIICVQDDIEYEVLQSYLKSVGISYTMIAGEDAAKLLYSGDGVGAGCYTMHGAEETERDFRCALARYKKNEISCYTGYIALSEPKEVFVTSEANEPIYRPNKVYVLDGHKLRRTYIPQLV